ncbi:MAG: hypothetical protein IJI07_08010 [Flexilinea sp.]|nr:hypothetical protein [Flexilinea sp.]
MTAAGFSTKAKKLFRGRRPFPGRLLLAIFPSLALSFTLFFFGPLDLTYISRNYISYSPFSILPAMAVITGAVFLVLTLSASVPGGKVHAFLVSAYTGLSAGIYIQGAFLNPDFGTMDGHTVNWPSFSTMMMINCAVWFVILLIPHLIHYFSNQIWRRSVMLICGVLVLMQGVSLIVKLREQAVYDRGRTGTYYLTAQNMLKVGSKNNVVVFMLDTTSDTDVEQMLEKYPDSLSLFHDFTRYSNANSHYMFTVPSLVNLLTGEEWDCENVRIADYLDGAWKTERSASFYKKLADKGFERNFYVLLPEAANDPSVLSDAFSTLKYSNDDHTISRKGLVKLIKLSFYRYFPITMKPFFVIYTSDIANLVSHNDPSDKRSSAMESEWDLVIRMNEEQLSEGPYKNAFIFYYLQGTHLPYRLDAHGKLINSDLPPEYLTNYSEKEDQLAGFFYLIENYIRQLKAMGLYDQTGIIILSDHGNNQEKTADHQPLYLIKMPGEKHDEMVTRTAPITIQDCFRADVMAMTGGSDHEWGIPSGEVTDDLVERWTRVYAIDESLPFQNNKFFNVMHEFRYEGDGKILMDQWTEDAYETVSMIDSYY